MNLSNKQEKPTQSAYWNKEPMKLPTKKHHPTLSEDRLGNIFRRYPQVEAVFLFGSGASTKTHHESDLDLAIYPNDPSVEKRKLGSRKADILEIDFAVAAGQKRHRGLRIDWLRQCDVLC